MTAMVPTLINGRWALHLPEHRAVRPQWDIANGGWERERLDDIASHIEAGVVARGGYRMFDIGAEEGDMPALWAVLGAEVVCVEPNPAVWPNIRAIFDGNRLPTPGCFVGFAGPEPRGDDQTVGWPDCADGPVIGDHGFCQLNERPDLPVTTIDRLTDRYGPPDGITLDVEGSEYEVLRGAIDTLSTFRSTVWASVHAGFMLRQYDTDPGLLFKLMDDLGYDASFLDHDHESHWRWDPR